MVFFKTLDISSEDNCTDNWLLITDGNSSSNRSLAGGKQCGDEFPKDLYTTEGRELTATFHSNETLQGSGFELIITAFHTGNCSVSETQCRNGRCVSRMETGCDASGYNPCGDWSDCDTITVPTYYLDENCNGTLYVSNTVPLLLNLTRGAQYQPNMRCQVTITGTELNRLMVYISRIDIENHGTCDYDWVEIDDGKSRADAYIAGRKLCGSSAPRGGSFTTSGKSMTVYFHSDGSDQFRGFSMVITAFHTGTCLSNEHQCDNGRCISIESTCLGYNTCGDGSDCPVPQPPASVSSVFLVDRCYSYGRLPVNGQIRLQLTRHSTYPPNLNCYQTFESGYGQRMMVSIRSLHIENEGTCDYDWVEIDDGISRSSPYINGRKLCGSNVPTRVYETSGRYLTVYFHSDGSQQFSGFDVIITSYHMGTCSSDEFHCDNSKCISKSIPCSGFIPCSSFFGCNSSLTTQLPLSTSVYYMDKRCGTTLSQIDHSFGQFHLKLTRSQHYVPGMRCQMSIETSPGSHIFIKFLSIDLEQNSDCSYDYVELYDGVSRFAHNLADGRRCGSTRPSGYFTTSGHFLTVYFHSDSSTQGTGFDLLIQPSVKMFMDQHCGDTISIGDDSQIRLKLTNSYHYKSNIQCQITIATNYNEKMMFYFRDLDTENACSNDWLEIDDGTSRGDPYLAGGKQCGHTTPTAVYTTRGPYMTLYFESDISIEGRGFDMIITSFRDSWYCNPGEHSCANGRCINASLVCDGYNSCGDYSDCTTRSCKTDEFQCDNGRCVPNTVRCTSSNPCGDYSDYSDCSTTTTTTTTTTTDYYTYYYDGLSGSAIAGITLGTTTFFILLFVAACYGARRRATPLRRVPNTATVSTVAHAYENPVPIYYAGPPPPYPGTSTTTGYPGTSALYPPPQVTAVSGTVDTIPTISCGATVTNQGDNGVAFQLQQK